MKQIRLFNILSKSFTVLLLISCTSCQLIDSSSNISATPVPAPLQSNQGPIFTIPEYLCMNFVTSKLMHDGAIRTNYVDTPFVSDYATGEEILSESQGLFMLYAAKINNKTLFDSAYSLVTKTLDNGMTLSYRYTPNEKEVYPVNAAIDDLRIIKSLFLASNTFNDSSYKDKALYLADRFYDTNIHKDQLYDFYDINLKKTNDFITLCYIDLSTLKELSNYNKKWDTVFSEMLDILANGYIDDTFPLFNTRYSYKRFNFDSVETISTVESLITACHLSEVHKCPSTTINYIKTQLQNGAIFSSYYLDGTPATNVESTAIYALCAQLGGLTADKELYELSINKMNQFQVRNTTSPIYGAFGNTQTHEAFSFDNLMALLAYRIGDSL